MVKKDRKKMKYNRPLVKRIPIDVKQMVKNATGGCPYVFIWNGKKYIKENTLLPNSEDILRNEKILTDYCVLQAQPQEENGEIKLKISEFEKELSWLNGFGLMTIEHPQDYKIGFTTKGRLLSYKDPIPPIFCVDYRGRDYLNLVNNQNWKNLEKYYYANPSDFLELEFKYKSPNNNLKLIIVDPNDKNDWFDMAAKCSIHIYFYMDVKWKHIAVLHTRAEFYPDIIDLTSYLPQIKGNLKIKLEFTAKHKVSFVGIDTTPPIPMKKRIYKLAQAIHSDLGDVTKALREENDQFTRLMPGEEIELKFPAPEPAKKGNKLSYVLVSRGYYIPTTKLMSLSKEAMIV